MARLIIVLTVVCLAAGLLLACVNKFAAGPIAAAAMAEKTAAIKKTLPECDNDPNADRIELEDAGRDWTFYVARKNGNFAGVAFEAMTSKGYAGTIRVMVGVNADGNVQAIEIVEHKETPGLGAKIAGAEFKRQFAGKSIWSANWTVQKDKGDIDQITAATISSRAVVGAVKQGLEVYKKYESVIRSPGNGSGAAL